MAAKDRFLPAMRPSSPKLNGVVETVLYVHDLARASVFYRQVLGLESAGGDGVRFQAFVAGPQQVLLLFKRGATLQPITLPGGVIPAHDGNGEQHIGFGISADSYEDWKAKLLAAGTAIESEATWPQGARSLYFRDPDRHLVELVTPGIWPVY